MLEINSIAFTLKSTYTEDIIYIHLHFTKVSIIFHILVAFIVNMSYQYI